MMGRTFGGALTIPLSPFFQAHALAKLLGMTLVSCLTRTLCGLLTMTSRVCVVPRGLGTARGRNERRFTAYGWREQGVLDGQ
jgi:hypothetical protein